MLNLKFLITKSIRKQLKKLFYTTFQQVYQSKLKVSDENEEIGVILLYCQLNRKET